MAKKKQPKVFKVERTRNMGTMTEAEYFGKIRNALRKTFAWWKPMQEALKLARRPSQNKERSRLKWEYQCANCKLWFAVEDVQVDHITPVSSLEKLSDVPMFIYRLTAEEVEKYQILCKGKTGCHQEKTNKENDERREKRREKRRESSDY